MFSIAVHCFNWHKYSPVINVNGLKKVFHLINYAMQRSLKILPLWWMIGELWNGIPQVQNSVKPHCSQKKVFVNCWTLWIWAIVKMFWQQQVRLFTECRQLLATQSQFLKYLFCGLKGYIWGGMPFWMIAFGKIILHMFTFDMISNKTSPIVAFYSFVIWKI